MFLNVSVTFSLRGQTTTQRKSCCCEIGFIGFCLAEKPPPLGGAGQNFYRFLMSEAQTFLQRNQSRSGPLIGSCRKHLESSP